MDVLPYIFYKFNINTTGSIYIPNYSILSQGFWFKEENEWQPLENGCIKKNMKFYS